MTYKHYILSNRVKDSKAAYAEYLEKNTTTYPIMHEQMKKQYVDGTYIYRFALQIK